MRYRCCQRARYASHRSDPERRAPIGHARAYGWLPARHSLHAMYTEHLRIPVGAGAQHIERVGRGGKPIVLLHGFGTSAFFVAESRAVAG